MVHQVEYCLWSLISLLLHLFQLLRKAITMAPISCKFPANLPVSAHKRPTDHDHGSHREIFEARRRPELLKTVVIDNNIEHRDHLDSKVGDGLVINGESVHGDLRTVRMRALDSTDIGSTVVDGAMVSNKARKRPTRIMIPVSYAGLGLEGVEKDHAVEKELEVEGNGYFLSSRKGRRHTMEDGYGVLTNIHGDSKQALFGVFDGHGGRAGVDFVIENLGKNIITEVSKMDEDDDGRLEVGIKNGYFTTDREFLNKGVNSGVCVATVLLKSGDLHVSNVGDCRVVMSRNGVANALTRDHRAGRDDERARIESSGGYISCRNGVWRVQGTLAVSRAIGDLNLKEWVISEPETKKLRLTPDCEFLVMASDGLWDKVSNQEAIDTVSRYKNSIRSCKELVDMASRRGSRDDITVMVVDLQRFVQLGG